jgi:hypothetical protein
VGRRGDRGCGLCGGDRARGEETARAAVPDDRQRSRRPARHLVPAMRRELLPFRTRSPCSRWSRRRHAHSVRCRPPVAVPACRGGGDGTPGVSAARMRAPRPWQRGRPARHRNLHQNDTPRPTETSRAVTTKTPPRCHHHTAKPQLNAPTTAPPPPPVSPLQKP